MIHRDSVDAPQIAPDPFSADLLLDRSGVPAALLDATVIANETLLLEADNDGSGYGTARVRPSLTFPARSLFLSYPILQIYQARHIYC